MAVLLKHIQVWAEGESDIPIPTLDSIPEGTEYNSKHCRRKTNISLSGCEGMPLYSAVVTFSDLAPVLTLPCGHVLTVLSGFYVWLGLYMLCFPRGNLVATVRCL